MNRDRAKKLLPIIQAYVDGETVILKYGIVIMNTASSQSHASFGLLNMKMTL